MASLAQMHTAEHLLSAVMRKHFGAPRNLEFHLGEKKTKCDYKPERPVSATDIESIETLVNEQITRNLPVSSYVVARQDAAEHDLWKVPAEAERIRVVRIGDYDAQPCRGEHVNATAEIGRFEISSFDLRDNGRLRIRFKLN